MKHVFFQHEVTEVEVLWHPSQEEPVIFPTGEPELRVGCWTCNMGLAEALTLPCPGRPVEKMLEPRTISTSGTNESDYPA